MDRSISRMAQASRKIQKIVVNYLNAHPEEWQKPASVLVKQALKQVWGTQGKPSGS